MTLEKKLLNGLVQVYTRGKINGVQIRVFDGTPIPPFDIDVSKDEFLAFFSEADLSTLSIRSLVDVSSLYFEELKDVLEREFKRRKETEPDFSERLSKEVMPRLRNPSDPSWRFSD